MRATTTRAIVAAAIAGLAWVGTRAAEAPAVDHGTWLRDQLTSARPGTVIDVPAGEHHGPFVVSTSVRLRGHGQAVLVGDGQTHVIAVTAPDVVIEGFEIRGSGTDLTADHAAIHITGPRAVIEGNRIVDSLHGVYVRRADDVRIEGNTITGKTETMELVNPFEDRLAPGAGELCEVPLGQDRRGNGIHLWNSSGHVIAGNVIRETRDGIYFSFVDRTVVHDNDIARVRYGLHYMYSDDNRFEANTFRDNAAGAALMYSKGILLRDNRFLASRNHRAHGLLLHSVDETEVRGNEIVGNTMGLFVENSQGNRILDNRIVGNHIGLHISTSSDGNVFAGNAFSGNIHPVETEGVTSTNRWVLDGRGNYWQGAARLDLDGDGVSDVPHRELDLFGQWRRSFPAIGLLAGSPGERLLRFVYARIPTRGPSAILDPAPLVRPAAP